MLGVFPIAHGGKGDLKITLSFSLLGGDKKPLQGLCLLVMGNRRSAACPVNRLALQDSGDEQVHGRPHQVVDRGDQRPGRYRRILVELIEDQRFDCTDGGRGGEG